MSLPTYSKYKDSGVPWLGEVPAHWEVKRLKYACRVMPSNVDKKSYDGEAPIALCNYTDVYYNEQITRSIAFMDATASDEQISRFTLRGGDTIVTKDSETADDIAISAYIPEDMPGVVCGYHLAIIRPKHQQHGLYIKRLFDSHYLKACFAVAANGLTRVGLSQYALDNVVIPLPPSDEQSAIAVFLDCEIQKIGALIAEQEKLLALLAEKRQATISHAVTRGLNPDAPMKDSGVAWLGQVPAHWTIKRMKQLVREGVAGPYGSSLTKSMYVNSGYRVYGQQQVIPNDFSIGDYYISGEKFAEMRRYEVKPNDVLISVMGTIGKAALVPSGVEQGIINPRLVLYRVHEDSIAPRYLQVFINSDTSQKYFSLAAQGTTMEGLNMVSIGELHVTVPPRGEQDEILRFVDLENEKLNSLASHVTTAIALLKERRSALIAAAVTGKIDVRSRVQQELAA